MTTTGGARGARRGRPGAPPLLLPLTGRDEELAYLAEVRRTTPGRGVVVAGAQGVGKTRLVTEAAAAARTERWSVERIDGASAADSVPLSALAHLASPEDVASGDPLRQLVAIMERLTRQAARRRLVMLVDDGHLLDEASLALLHRLATLPTLMLLVTVRTDEPVPAPITGLWKEGHAHRLELQPMSRDETYRLATEALGDPEPATLQLLWSQTLGNPLFLRELILADAAGEANPAGVLGEPGGDGRRLAEVVQTRLGRLSTTERKALAVLTLTGPIGLDLLGRIVPAAEIEALIDRGLLAVRDDESHPVALLAHPIYGVVTNEALSTARARALRTELVAHLEQLQSRQALTPRDAVRLVTLRLDLGVRISGHELLAAVNYVRAAYPRAVAERLTVGSPQIDGATTAVASGEPGALPSQDELVVLERLARRAWEGERTLAAGLALTSILVASRNVEEASRLVEGLASLAGSEWERTQVTLAEAALAYWVLGETERAEAVLAAAEADVEDEASIARLRRLRAGIALNVGRVTEAVDLAGSLLRPPPTSADGVGDRDVELEAILAAATVAAGTALLGQAEEAMDIAGRFVSVAQARAVDVPEVLGQLMLARCFAARVLGRFDEAEWLAYACYRPAVENGSTNGMAIFTGMLGLVALDKGQPTTAVRRLREAEILLRDCDTFGYRPFVLANLAVGLAQLGEAEEARQTCERAAATATGPRYFDSELVLAEAWAQAADGRMAEASSTAQAAAARAGTAGLHPFEAGALHAVVRFGQAGEVEKRLDELARTTGSPLVETYARHAAACAVEDYAALLDASDAFEQLGAFLLAAEAAGQAAAGYNRTGARREASTAAARIDRLGDRLEGARSPSLRLAVRPSTLTSREHEVAMLAADGLTSKEIAERLVVSPRTVESHLYRVFAKLGVADRAELADLLAL